MEVLWPTKDLLRPRGDKLHRIPTTLTVMRSFALHFLQINNWSPSEEHGGQIRKFTFKSLCNSPLCPPYTAVTEQQHATMSTDKGALVS